MDCFAGARNDGTGCLKCESVSTRRHPPRLRLPFTSTPALGIGIGIVDAGYGGGGDCYYVRRTVIVPAIGPVSRRQLVCE